MTFKPLKERARGMRKRGKSISEISLEISTSKSTVSFWCRDIVPSREQLRVLAQRQRRAGALGRIRAAEARRFERIQNTKRETDRGTQDIGRLTDRDFFILGVGLYWGEGYKNGNEECGLTNSDPAIISAFIMWLRKVYRVQRTDLILRVSINQTHAHRVKAVERYWSRITHVPLSQFTKTSLIKARARKKYENSDHHFGTLRVKVRRATSLRRRLMGSIAELRRQATE